MQVHVGVDEEWAGLDSRVYLSNGFNDRAVGFNLNKTWRLMLRVKSMDNEGANKKASKRVSDKIKKTI